MSKRSTLLTICLLTALGLLTCLDATPMVAQDGTTPLPQTRTAESTQTPTRSGPFVATPDGPLIFDFPTPRAVGVQGPIAGQELSALEKSALAVVKLNYEQCIAMANQINMPHTANESLWGLGNLALAAGDFPTAKRYFAQSGRAKSRNKRMAGGPGWAALGLGELAEAKQLFQADLSYMLDTDAKPAGLNALVGFANLEAQAGEVSRALELLTLVIHHSASTYEIREKARKMWDELAAELSPDVVAEAEVRGMALDLWKTAEELAGPIIAQ